jgi:YfiH family protein
MTFMTPLKSSLLEPDQHHIRHGFFTKQGDTLEAVAAAFAVPLSSVVRCEQIHSADVVTVTGPWLDEARPEADALVTDQRGIVLAVRTADCGPVLLADPVAGVIAAAHAGWRGAKAGIIARTLEAMIQKGAEPARVRGVVGPCIGPQSYEVDAEFRYNFLEDDQDNERFFVPAKRSAHFMFNLPAYIVMKLEAAGIGHKESLPCDTCQDEARFYSHRRACDKGRQFSAIMMTGA